MHENTYVCIHMYICMTCVLHMHTYIYCIAIIHIYESAYICMICHVSSPRLWARVAFVFVDADEMRFCCFIVFVTKSCSVSVLVRYFGSFGCFAESITKHGLKNTETRAASYPLAGTFMRQLSVYPQITSRNESSNIQGCEIVSAVQVEIKVDSRCTIF